MTDSTTTREDADTEAVLDSILGVDGDPDNGFADEIGGSDDVTNPDGDKSFMDMLAGLIGENDVPQDPKIAARWNAFVENGKGQDVIEKINGGTYNQDGYHLDFSGPQLAAVLCALGMFVQHVQGDDWTETLNYVLDAAELVVNSYQAAV